MSIFIFQMVLVLFSSKRIRNRTHVPNNFRQTIIDKHIGVIANFLWLFLLGYSIFLPLLFRSIWFYIGFFVFIFGTLLLLLSTLSFITTPTDELIQRGVYKISRHPMYLATFLICLGAGIASASLIFIILSVIFFVCLHYEASVEERYCHNIYKNQYEKYKHRVPMWFGLPR